MPVYRAMPALLPAIALMLAPMLSACGDGGRAERLAKAGPNPGIAQLMQVADADAGAAQFGQCAACHTIGKGAPDRAGPNLHGVVGRAVAGKPGFGYSHALQSLGGTWDAARLDAWLANPAKVAPGTTMLFSGMPDPLARADLIAYLSAQSEK